MKSEIIKLIAEKTYKILQQKYKNLLYTIGGETCQLCAHIHLNYPCEECKCAISIPEADLTIFLKYLKIYIYFENDVVIRTEHRKLFGNNHISNYNNYCQIIVDELDKEAERSLSEEEYYSKLRGIKSR